MQHKMCSLTSQYNTHSTFFFFFSLCNMKMNSSWSITAMWPFVFLPSAGPAQQFKDLLYMWPSDAWEWQLCILQLHLCVCVLTSACHLLSYFYFFPLIEYVQVQENVGLFITHDGNIRTRPTCHISSFSFSGTFHYFPLLRAHAKQDTFHIWWHDRIIICMFEGKHKRLFLSL